MFPIDFVVIETPVSWRGKASAKRKWMEQIRLSLGAGVDAPLVATGDEVRVHIRYYYGEDSPLIDPDNLAKPVLDAMEPRVYHNDRQICDLRVDRVDMTKPLDVAAEPDFVQKAFFAASEFIRVTVVLANTELE